jgi:3'-phosphoadenosine 5'-phosphosulfate sulfotransferase (PAPS reductase)/FAD synthetase
VWEDGHDPRWRTVEAKRQADETRLAACVMRDPFKINGPTCLSISGGRTSGYMLWCVLQSNGGKLPDEAIACFANTGKEEEATLRFIRDMSVNWNVPIVWVIPQQRRTLFRGGFRYRQSPGEPFRNHRKAPIPTESGYSFRGVEDQSMHRHLESLGWKNGDGWDQMIGIRAIKDGSPARPSPETVKETMVLPLADAGITLADVQKFWDAQPFNLELITYNGRTLSGNCDLCFLKPANQIQTLISEKPNRADWWASMEALALASKPNGARFRSDRRTYAEMKKNAGEQIDAFGFEEAIPCFCGD